MATKKNSELFSSLLYIAIGILLAIYQDRIIDWAIFVVGAIFIVFGILDVIKKNYTGGAISLIIGIAIILLGGLFKDIVFTVLGILIAVKGIVALIDAFKKSNKNALDLVFPVLTTVVGLLLAFGNGVDIMILIVGILLAIDGVIGLIGAMKK